VTLLNLDPFIRVSRQAGDVSRSLAADKLGIIITGVSNAGCQASIIQDLDVETYHISIEEVHAPQLDRNEVNSCVKAKSHGGCSCTSAVPLIVFFGLDLVASTHAQKKWTFSPIVLFMLLTVIAEFLIRFFLFFSMVPREVIVESTSIPFSFFAVRTGHPRVFQIFWSRMQAFSMSLADFFQAWSKV
jgi:hypothetical protein